jgi:hypothetical protein
MAGHPLLNQVRSKSEEITVNGETYYIELSYNRVAGIPGFVVGLKFSDANGSMDSAMIKHPPNPYSLAKAVAWRAVQMLKPDLDNVSIMGFYLLTEEIDARGPNASKAKTRIYNTKATTMHRELKDKLQYLAAFEVEGGVGWAMSVNHYSTYQQFDVFQNELAKQMRMAIC